MKAFSLKLEVLKVSSRTVCEIVTVCMVGAAVGTTDGAAVGCKAPQCSSRYVLITPWTVGSSLSPQSSGLQRAVLSHLSSTFPEPPQT